ncbi:DUF2771 family protein [Parasphingorhabdus pacifica]
MLAVAGIAVAGCSAPTEPQVTFYSHGNSVEVQPAQYCDASGEDCAPPPADPVGELEVPPDTPLQISVPQEVATTPWQVAFVYRTDTGEEINGRSEVFSPTQRHSYTLRLPPEGTQLEHVEVQQFSAVLTPGPEGGVNFGIGGSWVLDAKPEK